MKQLLSMLAGLMLVSNVYANDTKEIGKEKLEERKEAEIEQATEKKHNKHDVMKTKFLGKRPYIETKVRE